MDSKKQKPMYEPPVLRDLSGISAAGGGISPTGMCLDGSALTTEFCSGGGKPEGGTCGPNGISPNFGYCQTGNEAVEGCTSGGIHQ